MQNYKPINTHVVKGESLSQEMGPKTLEERDLMAHVPYSSAIESLMYAIICTHPNIFYAIRLVSRY